MAVQVSSSGLLLSSPPSAHTSYGHSRFHSSDIGLGGMDVVPGGVNQWWFPWPRKAHVAGGFARVVLGWSNGRLGFGDSEILGLWDSGMFQCCCSRWVVGSVLEDSQNRRGPQTLASPNDLQELVRAGLGAASKQT
ncbi:uncharacterized protein K444DRAFT_709878 [Hyaloscypha bicolor E]|uniref:Uncharacterized protein n=1 Tax=Hyaloscypha bicolor E TaxID=1095630 RepID=A0A2J6SHK6_9HELO|nr:uncharacterized protein K444DRAFT_709878 [Hyaloscypha bicolor E]PMD50256.1 hypothetical protein K444DRAFT_709878 [Hyaloscypha bicolor E]